MSNGPSRLPSFPAAVDLGRRVPPPLPQSLVTVDAFETSQGPRVRIQTQTERGAFVDLLTPTAARQLAEALVSTAHRLDSRLELVATAPPSG